VFDISNKLNKIWLKRLNPHIYRVEGLYWFKVSKSFQISKFTFYLFMQYLLSYTQKPKLWIYSLV